MNFTWIFMVGLALTLPAAAADIGVSSFDPDKLQVEGSFCTFERKANETILASDWDKKFWMKIDGTMIELTGHRSEAEVERQVAAKRWQETLRANDLTVRIDLVEDGQGEDAVGYKGRIEVARHGATMRIPVTVGCSA